MMEMIEESMKELEKSIAKDANEFKEILKIAPIFML